MSKFYKILIFILFFTNFIQSNAEGTKQLRPSYTDDAHIVVMRNDNFFASYNAPANYKLQFNISNLNERVYFGFGRLKIENDPVGSSGNIGSYNENLKVAAFAPLQNVYFRILDPSGTQVYTGIIPTSGQGYIGDESLSSYNSAVSGPSQLVGPAGYNGFKFIPTTLTGEYSIEFNVGDPSIAIQNLKTSFQLFDLTVTNGKGPSDPDITDIGPVGTSSIEGRLWSKGWGFSTGSNQAGGDPFNQNLFKAKLFPYAEDGNIATLDGVVTSINFNGMDPFGFNVSCNKNGISNATGDFVLDKQSVYGAVPGLPGPLYKIFLQDPDNIVYPSGQVGCLKGASVSQCSSGNAYCINIFAVATGDISIIIDLNGADGIYTPGTRDVFLKTTINDGEDYTVVPKCVAWDGLDGLGVQVPDGNIQIVVAFYAGLTNLPINDVENNINGFQVDLVRPLTNSCGGTIIPPKLYWSDLKVAANIPPANGIDGIENLAGCDPTMQGPGIGCHRWSGRGANTDPSGYVMETMNTWWYVAEDKRTISYLNDNSLFGISANFGNVTCAYNDFDKITIDVEYSVAKFVPSTFVYTITPPVADNYQFIGQNVINMALPSPTPGKKIARIEYTIDVNKDLTQTVSNVSGITFDYLVETNQCGSTQGSQKTFTCTTPLPVSWMYFWGNKTNEKTVVLEWTTAEEINNSGFWIERSSDGKTFTELAFIAGNGSTKNKNKYSYTDNQALSTTSFYRLKQIEKNNESFNYSKMISIGIESLEFSLLSSYYENAERKLNIEVVQSHVSNIDMKLYNSLGVIVNQITFPKVPGNSATSLEALLPELSTGIYILDIRNDKNMVRRKIMIN